MEGGKPYPLFKTRARQTSCSLHSIWQSSQYQAVRIFDFLNSSTKVNKLSRCVAHRLQAEWHQGATYPKPCWSNPCPPSRGWMTSSFSISSPMDPTCPLWVLYLYLHGQEELPLVHRPGPDHLPVVWWPHHFLFYVLWEPPHSEFVVVVGLWCHIGLRFWLWWWQLNVFIFCCWCWSV